MKKNKTINNRINELEKLLDVQTKSGNWDHDPYMHGMANGMILAMSVITEESPEFLAAPEIFIADIKTLDKFNNSSIIVHNINKSADNETD